MDKENVDSKTDFLFTLSHEIKNALNIINAMCCVIENNIDNRERALQYLTRVYSITEHISEIMNKSLDMIVFNSNRSDIKQEPFKLDKLEEELYQLILPMAENKDIDFRVINEHAKERVVLGDYSGILQILINIATNSIKYTHEGGLIIIRVEEESSCMTETIYNFRCIDNGIGMNEEFIEHIFDPFVRADDDRVRQAKGTGLGMSIVKGMVEAMKGSIHIASAVDAGTTVTIKLKLKNYIRKG